MYVLPRGVDNIDIPEMVLSQPNPSPDVQESSGVPEEIELNWSNNADQNSDKDSITDSGEQLQPDIIQSNPNAPPSVQEPNSHKEHTKHSTEHPYDPSDKDIEKIGGEFKPHFDPAYFLSMAQVSNEQDTIIKENTIMS